MAGITIKDPAIIKHKSPFFHDGFLSMAVIGKSGCGKSRAIAAVLPGISDSIDTILIATIVKDVPLHLAIQKYFNDKGKFCVITHDPYEAREFVDMAQELGEVTEKKQGLLLVDDFNDGRSSGPYWDFVVHAFTKLRNNGWNFIIAAQQPQFLPTIVRNCTTQRMLFDCYSKTAFTTFTRDVADRVPDQGAYDTLLDYIRAVPYTYMMIREHPFEISAGKLDKFKPVMNEHNVDIPTLSEIEREMGVSGRHEIDMKSRGLQRRAGNTARQLNQSTSRMRDVTGCAGGQKEYAYSQANAAEYEDEGEEYEEDG
jgi:hypothetical protein